MPLRDDWKSAAELISRIDKAIAPDICAVQVLLVDDGSSERFSKDDFCRQFSAIRAIRVLPLRRNLGHQRAIAIGLAYIQKTMSCDAVLVMDADGEDTPEGVAKLLRAYLRAQGLTAIFAERTRRSESLAFQGFYRLYRVLHLVLTGIKVRVGNFSIVPAPYLETLVAMSELWNHYAAAVFRSKLPLAMIPIERGKRITGASRMNFVALVSHGLSAISVFGDIVGVRLLIASFLGSVLVGIGIILVVLVRVFTDLAIPAWGIYATGTLGIVVIQFITIAATFTFFILSDRTNLGFVPLRDYFLFVKEPEDLFP